MEDFPSDAPASDEHESEEIDEGRFAEDMRWMCAFLPGLFERIDPNELEPEVYPEHRVLAEHIRRRQQVRRAMRRKRP